VSAAPRRSTPAGDADRWPRRAGRRWVAVREALATAPLAATFLEGVEDFLPDSASHAAVSPSTTTDGFYRGLAEAEPGTRSRR
jgi:hypothetical protein